jgi:hypothetical protein
MTKPVAVFRSRVIEDSRHTVRLDENIHLVLFPSFSRYITSWAIRPLDRPSRGPDFSDAQKGVANRKSSKANKLLSWCGHF